MNMEDVFTEEDKTVDFIAPQWPIRAAVFDRLFIATSLVMVEAPPSIILNE